MTKKGLIIFGFLFVSIFLLSFVASASCTIKQYQCNYGEGSVMRLSSTTNAHGALYNQGTYEYYLCCDFTGTHTCSGSNKVVGLSSTSNAHAEIPILSSYTSSVCFGNLTCYTTSSTCNSGDIQMVSLSATTNAHIGSFSTYNTKICCSPNLAFCSNGIVEGTEQCDDGNVNPGDCCSSTCVIEPGCVCNTAKTCCYPTSPTTSWQKILLSGQQIPFNSGGELRQDEILIMIVNDDLCVTPGAGVNFEIYKDLIYDEWIATKIGTAQTDSISASIPITSSILNKLGSGTSNIYFVAETDENTFQSQSIPVTPVMCDLTSVSWNTTSAIAGDPVRINLAGTNCDGKEISFEIWEKDGGWPNYDDFVIPGPSNIIYGQPNTYVIWNTVFQDDTDGGQHNPPEYYIIAKVVGASEEITSSKEDADMLKVNPACVQNTICEPSLGENCLNCPDCACSGSTPICSESGVCVPECVLTSKSWNVSSAVDGEQVQLRVYGTNCDGEAVSFTVKEYDWAGEDDDVEYNPSGTATMTNGLATKTWIAEWPGYGDGETSPEYYFIPRINALDKEISNKTPRLSVSSGIYSPDCAFVKALWDRENVVEGANVSLNVQTINCNNGEIISFTIKEDDVGLNPDDDITTPPANVSISGNSATGKWTAEWQDDTDGGQTDPPEYYFEAKIISNGQTRKSGEPLLSVTKKDSEQCIGIGSCANYKTATLCNTDACNVGYKSVPSGIICGVEYNEETRCYEETDCGCSWNDDSDYCEPDWDTEVNCGNCGNGVRDFGEECDDGNTNNNDGCCYDTTDGTCSAPCQFEEDIPQPCPEGLTLCEDGTCSLNCFETNIDVATCDYDNECNEGESCTCRDCNGEQDECANELVCSIFDSACCKVASDGKCNPYCSYIDPDCGGIDGVCGNGLRETGEQCDLGELNGVGSGCFDNCTLQVIGPGVLCPEGTTLCNDETCSLNCYKTDEGNADCKDSSCCVAELGYSIIDQACCNDEINFICNPSCAYADPDCDTEEMSPFAIGKCSYKEQGTDTCEDDGKLTRDLIANWTWDSNNEFYSNLGEDYLEDPIGGIWHYDPLPLPRKSAKCVNITDTRECPAQIEVPFFNIYNLIITIVVIALIYIVIMSRKKKK